MSTSDNEPGRVPFAHALDKIFDRNEKAGSGPDSLRSLAREMWVIDHPGEEPTHKQLENARRQLRRYMTGEQQPYPDTVAKIATAARAKPEEFPPRRSQAELLRQLAKVELEAEDLRARLDHRHHRGHS